MAQIKVERATEERLAELQTDRWSSWECGVETFDWEYAADEVAYVKEGKVTVEPVDGEAVTFGAGDIVWFPRGMRCRWIVHQPIRKVFRLG